MHAQALPVCRPEATLKRCRFGTLKTSQRNWSVWPSKGSLQRLLSAMSKPAKPSPQITFREPLWPGKGCWKPENAAAGFAKTLTDPSGCLKCPVCGRVTICAIPCSSQFVGQKLPLSTVKGKPLVQRAKPESCHPPTIASEIAEGLP